MERRYGSSGNPNTVNNVNNALLPRNLGYDLLTLAHGLRRFDFA